MVSKVEVAGEFDDRNVIFKIHIMNRDMYWFGRVEDNHITLAGFLGKLVDNFAYEISFVGMADDLETEICDFFVTLPPCYDFKRGDDVSVTARIGRQFVTFHGTVDAGRTFDLPGVVTRDRPNETIHVVDVSEFSQKGLN